MRKTIRIITAVMLIIMMTAASFALTEMPGEQIQSSPAETEITAGETENLRSRDCCRDQ